MRILVGFENTKKIWFQSIDSRAKFCLYVAQREGTTTEFSARFGVSNQARLESFRAGNVLAYPVAQVREFSPDALAITEIMHQDDIAIVQKLYARYPKFNAHQSGLVRRRYMREIDMGTDRDDFGNDPAGVPLYEGRMVEAFDHRAKAYVSGRARKAIWRELSFGSPAKAIVPQWRIAVDRIPEKVGDRWRQFRIGFCDVGGVTNQRFLVAALIPTVGPCGHSVPTILFEPHDARLMCLWLGVANALCMDYLARKKAANHMTYTVMDSLPLPRIYTDSTVERDIAGRALRLCATGIEMRQFWEDTACRVGMDLQMDEPCETPQERDKLRAEIDVLVSRDLFNLTQDEMRYLLDPSESLGSDCGFDTFGALRRAETKRHGEFYTRRLILEAWAYLPASKSVGSKIPLAR